MFFLSKDINYNFIDNSVLFIVFFLKVLLIRGFLFVFLCVSHWRIPQMSGDLLLPIQI